MKALVIGLGSLLLKDDGVGPRVVRELAPQAPPHVRLTEAHAGGLALIDELVGSERAIIVDASLDPELRPGECQVRSLDTATRHSGCSHDCTLEQALALARGLGLAVPADDRITLVAIGVADVQSFAEELSPPVAAALPAICTTILALLAPTEVGHA